MYFEIRKWKGRLGNNINQIKIALFFCLYCKMNLKFPESIHFKNNSYELFKYDNKKPTYFTENDFVDINKLLFNIKVIPELNFRIDKGYVKKTFKNLSKNYEKVKSLLIDNFNIKNYKIYDNKTLIIYIRSGDLFNEDDVHPKYISPPYYFYEFILKKYKKHYKNFILVSEDTKNPVTKKLLENYPKIKYQKNNLEEDIKIILGAYDIVSTIGTFVKSLSWLSTNMNKVYLPSYVGGRGYYTDIIIEKIDVGDFKHQIGSWKNTKKQRQFLIDFVPDKI